MSEPYWPSGKIVGGVDWPLNSSSFGEAKREHNHQLAEILRGFASQVERDGLPWIRNNIPGWGDVVLLNDANCVKGNEHPGAVYDEAVLDTTGGKIQVLVGPGGITNCRAVLVLPLPGFTVRVRGEAKP